MSAKSWPQQADRSIHRNLWKSAYYYQTGRNQKYSTLNPKGSNHGIALQSGFRKCVLNWFTVIFGYNFPVQCLEIGQNAICQHRLRYVGFIKRPKFSHFCSHTALCHQYFDLYKSSVIQCGSLILKTVAVFAYSTPFNLTGKLIFVPSPDFKQEKHGKPNP